MRQGLGRHYRTAGTDRRVVVFTPERQVRFL
jgi:hypothetical protein